MTDTKRYPKCYLCGEEDNHVSVTILIEREGKLTFPTVCDNPVSCHLRQERRLRIGIGQEEQQRMIDAGAVRP